MNVEFVHLPKPRYLDRERDARIFDALHLYEVGYDMADGEQLPAPNFQHLGRVFFRDFIHDTIDYQIHAGIVDNEVCAMARFNPHARLSGHSNIEEITVHPEYRGQGIAKHLIGHLASLALTNDRHSLQLRVANLELEPYYAKLGFQRNEIIPKNPEQPFMAISAQKAAQLNEQQLAR